METRAIRAVSFIVALAAACGAHACGAQITGGDSESHFLSFCSGRCGAGLVCTCGVCTRPCDDTKGCGALSRRAECAAPSDSSCEVRVCDVACIEDDTCKSVGATHVCIQGRCRETLASTEAGAGGASGVGPSGFTATGTGGGVIIFPDGGTGGAGSVERPDAGMCGSSKTYPPPPISADAGGSIEFVVAQADIDFGDSQPTTQEGPTRFRSVGYNVDNLCTDVSGLKTSTSCVLPSASDGVLDGPGGIDNAFGQIIQTMRNLLTNFGSTLYSEQIRRGTPSFLIRVTEYNGAIDDGQVRLELMHSASFNAFSSDAAPKWDGNDVFPVDDDSVVEHDLGKAKLVDVNAYVNGGKLVAALGDMTFPNLMQFTDAYAVRMDLPLHGAFLVCDLSPTDVGRWGFTLRGCTLAGRLTADDFVQQLWHFPDPLDLKDPKPLCTDSTSYPGFKATVCNLRDIASSGTSGPTSPCDALSLGVSFSTVPASIGDVFKDMSSSPTCAAGADPRNDSCDSP